MKLVLLAMLASPIALQDAADHVHEIQDRVASILAVERGADLDVAIASPDEIARHRGVARLLEESDLDVRGTAWTILGLLDEGDDLAELVHEHAYLRAQTCYEPGAKLMLATGAECDLDRLIERVGEVALALIDRDRPIGAWIARTEGESQREAARAVLLGHVRWAVDRYLDRHLDEVASEVSLDESPAVAGVEVPPFVRQWLDRRRDAGARLVADAFARAGAGGIARLYARPPGSMSQVLRPDRELAREPLPAAPPSLAGWRTLDAGSMGASRIEAFSRLAGDPVRALTVARDWTQDRCQLHVHASGARFVFWAIRFETDEGAAKMVDALRKVLQQRYGMRDRKEQVMVEMDDVKGSLDARTESGAHRALARRFGRAVHFAVGLPDGVDVESLVAER